MKHKKLKKAKKPKPTFVIIEGQVLNEKTGLMEPVKYKIKVRPTKE